MTVRRTNTPWVSTRSAVPTTSLHQELGADRCSRRGSTHVPVVFPRPQVVSDRAIKHVHELTQLHEEGTRPGTPLHQQVRCGILFVVNRADCGAMRPCDQADRLFAQVVKRAEEAGEWVGGWVGLSCRWLVWLGVCELQISRVVAQVWRPHAEVTGHGGVAHGLSCVVGARTAAGLAPCHALCAPWLSVAAAGPFGCVSVATGGSTGVLLARDFTSKLQCGTLMLHSIRALSRPHND